MEAIFGIYSDNQITALREVVYGIKEIRSNFSHVSIGDLIYAHEIPLNDYTSQREESILLQTGDEINFEGEIIPPNQMSNSAR